MIILRSMQAHKCTMGYLEYEGFRCFTLELPWLFNQPSRSCIPEGIYDYKQFDSPSKGNVMLLEGVPARTWIEVHSGNYTKQIEGCIIVGDSLKDIDNDGIPDITNSKATLIMLLNVVPQSGQIMIVR